MKYRNVKNGLVINVSSAINDKDWELYDEASSSINSVVQKEESIEPQTIKEEVVKKDKTTTEKQAGKTATIRPKKKKEA